jgi:hypothetical protein
LPIALPPQLIAAKSGTVVGWGSQMMPPLEPNTNFVAVAGGTSFTVAIRGDGGGCGLGK